MDARSKKLHDIEKQSIIEEPTDQKLYIENQKEMLLHTTAMQILERHVKDLEDFKNNLDGSTCPELTEGEQAIVNQSNKLILKRFLILFQQYSKAFITLGDPGAEWVFWTRFMWLIEETQKYAMQSMDEQAVMDAPDFFKICSGEQDERLKPVYDKWDKTLFSKESFDKFVKETMHKFPIPEITPEQIAEMERQEQEDVEFDKRVLAEKCPTCPKQCEWYFEEKKKMSQNVPKNQGNYA